MSKIEIWGEAKTRLQTQVFPAEIIEKLLDTSQVCGLFPFLLYL